MKFLLNIIFGRLRQKKRKNKNLPDQQLLRNTFLKDVYRISEPVSRINRERKREREKFSILLIN